VRLLIHSRHWLLLAALALVALALGTAMFSGASFTSKSANKASLAAGSVQLSSTSPGQAIVNGKEMKPGDVREGTIGIGNEGNVPGRVTLLASGLSGTALASTLDLKVETVSGGTQVWGGKLNSFSSVALGSFSAKETRQYRFTLSWPAASSSASLQGTSTSLTFEWSGASEP